MIRKQQAVMCAFVVLGATSFAQTGGTGQTGQTGTPGQVGGTGQGTTATGQGSTAARTGNAGLSLHRSDKLIGTDVQDSTGGRLGRIDDLILRSDGTIAYAIIGNGQGGAEVPVPWQRLRMQTPPPDVTGGAAGASRASTFTLSGVDATRWKTAPSFDRNTWPKDGDTSVFTQSESFFGGTTGAGSTSGSGTGAGSTNGGSGTGGTSGSGNEANPVDASARRSGSMFRASKLQSQAVTDANGQPIGRFGQLVFDPAAGRLNYVSLSLENTPGASGRTVALPWETLRASRQDEKDRFQLSGSSDRLKDAPQFMGGEESWKQMSDPTWVNNMYGYYSVRPYWSGANGGRNDGSNRGGGTQDGENRGGGTQGGGENRGGTQGGDNRGGGDDGNRGGGTQGGGGGTTGSGNQGTGGDKPPH